MEKGIAVKNNLPKNNNKIMKMLFGKKCYVENCDENALLLSEPPSCFVHIQDMDEWYESIEGKLSLYDFDEPLRMVILALANNLYQEHLLHEYPANELFNDYKHRVIPDDKIQPCFPDTVYFILTAATTGIIGNITYHALKKLLSRVISGKGKIDEEFEIIIDSEKYEKIRKSIHPKINPKLEVDIEIELKIRRRYHLLFKKYNK